MPEQRHLDDAADHRGGDIAPQLIELEKIPRRLWEQTLVPLHPQLRFSATLRIADDDLREQAQMLVMELNQADDVKRLADARAAGRARRTSAPLPVPDAAHPAVQPTTLARALVLNGADEVLRERGAT